jgi:hypothetical protein
MIMFNRGICDVLLAHEHLDVHHHLHWMATFKTIRRIIGGVDYKVTIKFTLRDCFACG